MLGGSERIMAINFFNALRTDFVFFVDGLDFFFGILIIPFFH